MAAKTLLPVCEASGAALWLPAAIASEFSQFALVQPYEGSLSAQLPSIWAMSRSLVFGLATGAVVRLIAPLLQDKATDPAVVVVEEAGRCVISLCGGHQGGADRLTQAIAHHLNATPILTGSANAQERPGVDMWGVPFGWQKGAGDWTGLSAAIARQQPIQVIQTAGTSLWRSAVGLDQETWISTQEPDSNIPTLWITPTLPASPTPSAHWHPRVLWVGMGCERNTPRQVLEAAIQQVFQAHHLAEAAIAGIASLNLKADEVGLVELCGDRQLPLQCFSAEALRSVAVPTPSSVVEAEVGTPSVAEAAAILAAQSLSPTSNLLIPKQIFRLPNYPGAVTIAVAQADREYTGRTGKLWLVGTGPGALNQITPAAQTAIAQADVVIGYSLYVELVRPLLRPGQIVEALPITQERQRAERAIGLAEWGLTVAVISSGDCGIYGMAGLVLEALRSRQWNGKTPAVQVFPGITALQAAASRVGAPLMHDFCAISLSDLLTPWEVIEKRLTAAAQADFVVALYNPKSKTRTEQIKVAQQIFLTHRNPETPVAIVHSAYRSDEQVTLTTLTRFLEEAIDMLTVILIGNQSSQQYADWFITPRGYLGFEKS